VGEELGLTGSRLRALATGALVHDIGKLTVPDAILQKPGPLTEEEFRTIQLHPEWGEKMLADLGFELDVRQLVRDHHERLEGSGYPHGYEGSLISFDTRILAVCDVYDALISRRVYRDAWTHERAVELLHEESGTSFDAKCVAALERVLFREQLPAPRLLSNWARRETRLFVRLPRSFDDVAIGIEAVDADVVRLVPLLGDRHAVGDETVSKR
jgi:HD-GYP domain-containing protein (c-di-GMP phosphodiesterase class II)